MDRHGTTVSQTAAAAHNVLRRAEISRLTRTLKSRLALATLKTQCGSGHARVQGFEAELQQLEATAPKREIQQLQQGFVPQSQIRSDGSGDGGGGRKRARTFDNSVAAAAAKAGSVGSQLPATSMPAPRAIPNSQSVPHTMQHFGQLPPSLFTSPDSSVQAVEPQTPPSRQRALASQRTPTNRNDQDGADLLLYLATSPCREAMSPRTPGNSRDINFHEYLNLFTPSPQAERQKRLNNNIDSARTRLTFE